MLLDRISQELYETAIASSPSTRQAWAEDKLHRVHLHIPRKFTGLASVGLVATLVSIVTLVFALIENDGVYSRDFIVAISSIGAFSIIIGASLLTGIRAQISTADRSVSQVFQPGLSIDLELSWYRRRMLDRLGHIFPGATTWFLISALIWGPVVLPWPLAIGVLSFDVYWLIRSLSTAYHGVKGYKQLKLASGVDWHAEYTRALQQGKVFVPWDLVHHIIIIPNLNERVAKLRTTLEYLAAQHEATRQISVVLAMEEKEHEAKAKAELLQQEFRGQFAHMLATYHPTNLPGEVPGKSSNEAWAARWAKRFLVDELGYDLACLTVTSCDADSLFHPDYFRCLTYKFGTDPQRHRRFWQAPIFLYNNIWDVPMPTRVISVLSTINFLADLCKPHRLLFPLSTYSLSLQMAHEVGYWDPDVISEDWHMFLKCFFHLKGEVKTEALFVPIGTDAVKGETYSRSLVARYKQAKRHAWGAEDIGYGLNEVLYHPEIPLWSRAKCFWELVETHLVWSTHWFVLTLGGAVPALFLELGTQLTPIALLPPLTSLILTACLLPGMVIVALDLNLRPPAPPDKSRWFVAFYHLQWVLLPITSAIFASLPAVHAQTQLMLGKPLIYEVTYKA